MHHTPPLDWWINNVVMVRFLLSGTHALPLLLLHTYFSFLTSLSLSHCAFFPFPFSSRWVQPRSSQTGEKRQRQQPLTWPPSSHRGNAARVRRPLVLAHRRRGWHLSRIAGHRLVQRASYPPSRWCESQQKTTGRERRKRWQEPQSERETELNFWGEKKKKKRRGLFLLSYLRQCILTLRVLMDIDIMWIPLHLTQVCHDTEAATTNLYSDSDFGAAVMPEKSGLVMSWM